MCGVCGVWCVVCGVEDWVFCVKFVIEKEQRDWPNAIAAVWRAYPSCNCYINGNCSGG